MNKATSTSIVTGGNGRRIYKRYIKRPMDIALSIPAIVLFFPFMLIVALLVKLKLGSPVIFKQKRPGLNEKLFTLYKFRTMTNARDSKGELLSDNSRLTEFGKMLKSTSLDELPELFNIIVGHMSIVGPRPLAEEYLPYYTEEERHRHDMRPGLTGLAQIKGRNLLSWEERFELDNFYVENCSFRLDCMIIYLTILHVVKRSGVVSDEVRTDEIGEYYVYKGRKFRSLNEERSEKNV